MALKLVKKVGNMCIVEPTFEAQDEDLLRGMAAFDMASVKRAYTQLALTAKELHFLPCFKSITPDFAKAPSANIKLLKSVDLKSLQLNSPSKGCYVHGFISEKSFKFLKLAAILVKDNAGNAVQVLVESVVTSQDTDADVEKMYPEGAEVALKEPFLAKGFPGLHIVVGNPQRLEIISYFPQVTSEDADYLRGLGNQKFKERMYLGAVELYGRSISVSCTNQQKMLGYSNRAEVNLQLGRNEKAVEDAERALELDPCHYKSWSRKGRALEQLNQYMDAVGCFSKAIQYAAPGALKESYKKDYDNCSLLLSESLYGIHDLSEYVEAGCENNPKESAEFVGPVAVQSSGRRGRGLFVTRDVKMGDLLLVCNAAAVNVHDIETDFDEMDMDAECITRLLRTCAASSRKLSQISSMISVKDTRPGMLEVPSMDIFRPNCGYRHLSAGQDIENLDVPRLEGIWHRNKEYAHKNFLVRGSQSLFALTSLVNHSCLPNVCFLDVGFRTIFVFAGKDMKSGDEMVRSYDDCLKPGDCPSVFICQRCELEKRLGRPLAKIRKLYDDVQVRGNANFAKAVKERKGFGPGYQEQVDRDFIKVAVDLERLMNKQSLNLAQQQKNWLRVAYCNAYSTYYCRGVQDDMMPSTISFMKALVEHAPGVSRLLVSLQGVAGSLQKPDEIARAKEVVVDAVRGVFGSRLVEQRPDLIGMILKQQVIKASSY